VSVRAFVAVDVDDAARADAFAIADALGRAKAVPEGTRWVLEGDMHVTLKFLGSVSDDAIERISSALPGLASRPAPRLVVGPLHAFPTPTKARVIILDVADDGALAELAAALDLLAEREGVPRETRPYHAHLTLARLRDPRDVGPWLSSRPHAPRKTIATTITLYRSDTMASGARYTPIARAPFSAT
jgi:2'-5' RNA ligase